VLTVLELYVVGAAQARDEVIGAHLAGDLVVAGQRVEVLGVLDQEVGHGRVVAGVLAVEPGAVRELALQRLAEQRVEGLVLAAAHVDAADGEGDHILQALQVVAGPASLLQEPRRERPQVADPLHGRPRLEYFDGQGDVRDGKALQKVDRQLLRHVGQHAFLFIECLLISANQPTTFWYLQTSQYNFLLRWQLSEILLDELTCEVERRGR